jgi:hypothetical protein
MMLCMVSLSFLMVDLSILYQHHLALYYGRVGRCTTSLPPLQFSHTSLLIVNLRFRYFLDLRFAVRDGGVGKLGGWWREGGSGGRGTLCPPLL